MSAPCIRARALDDDRIEVEIRSLALVTGRDGSRAVLSFDEAERLAQALAGAMAIGHLKRRLAADQRALDGARANTGWC